MQVRERPEDVPLPVRYFSQKYARRMQKQIESIPAAAMRKLTRWHWPGNVRELQNLVERAVILTRSSTLAISVARTFGIAISIAFIVSSRKRPAHESMNTWVESV